MGSPRPTTIYALCHPETHEIRYVGKTVTTTNERLSSHQRDVNSKDPRKSNNHRVNWIRSVRPLKPTIIELEMVGDDWVEAEQFWIAYFRGLGARLVNHTLGGEGSTGRRHKPETIAKIKQYSHSAETRLRISEAVKRSMTPQRRRVISQNSKKIVVSAETKHKISTNNGSRGDKHKRGYTLSDSTKAKISISLKSYNWDMKNGIK